MLLLALLISSFACVAVAIVCLCKEYYICMPVCLSVYVSQSVNTSPSSVNDRLVGLVVKVSASRAEDPGLESRLRRDFFGVESYQ